MGRSAILGHGGLRPARALVVVLGLASCAQPEPKSPSAPAVVDVSRSTALPSPTGSRSVLFLDQPVHYRVAGSGSSTVLFVHGWSCTQEFWNDQLADPQLLEGRRLVAIDLPGHGGSPLPQPKLTMDLFADAIEAVLDDLGADQAVLVGHSNGTPVIRQCWRRHPDRVAALVVADGGLRSFFEDPAGTERFMAPLRSEQWQAAAAKIVDGMLPPSMPAERKEFIRSRMLAQPQRTMVEDFEASIDRAIWTEETIDLPVLVLNARSPSWTPEYVTFVRRLVPGVDYQEMRGVSHFLQMDAPAEFDARLDRFLDSIGR